VTWRVQLDAVTGRRDRDDLELGVERLGVIPRRRRSSTADIEVHRVVITRDACHGRKCRCSGPINVGTAGAVTMVRAAQSSMTPDTALHTRNCTMSIHTFETISVAHLGSITGGQQAQTPAPAPGGKDFAPVDGNVVQQAGRMIDNAAQGYTGARKAGASVYESIGNAAIGFFGLGGGFAPNGQPR
jgi:hypothetical protein